MWKLLEQVRQGVRAGSVRWTPSPVMKQAEILRWEAVVTSQEKWKLLELSLLQAGDLICRWIPPSAGRAEIMDRMNEVSRMVQAELSKTESERTDAKAGGRT